MRLATGDFCWLIRLLTGWASSNDCQEHREREDQPWFRIEHDAVRTHCAIGCFGHGLEPNSIKAQESPGCCGPKISVLGFFDVKTAPSPLSDVHFL
jgi:hypothetical protein